MIRSITMSSDPETMDNAHYRKMLDAVSDNGEAHLDRVGSHA